jgi:hypothetical protein
MSDKLNLSPDPRILPMLGEINLPSERCLAELIDNCIDAFSTQFESNTLTYDPEISIETPKVKTRGYSRISVKDNGPGMTTELLEKAVSAGWTGNDPINRLGLFGMGFNIATARLGAITEVWTTLEGEDCWRGIVINFNKLIENKTFEVDLVNRGKNDHSRSGTEIIISKLKSAQIEWFERNNNQTKLKKFLSQVYSSILLEDSKPFKITLSLNGNIIKPAKHCIWSDSQEHRFVKSAKHGNIYALQHIDVKLTPKKYCSNCWMWLSAESNECPACADKGRVINRERRVTGWLGILRYLSETDYGIDFIRNGRKIELLDRSLFKWNSENGLEDEYPIDDPRRRGRIVGEIHLDHCRVSYTKDRFERDDSAWAEMLDIVRGKGPLRPELAKSLGYEANESPLFKLFQAFRRSTPSSKVAGAYVNLLSVPNNDKAIEYSSEFFMGVKEFQTDHKWFELLEEADKELLTGSKGQTPVINSGELDGVFTPTSTVAEPNGVDSTPVQTPEVKEIYEELVPSLTQVYVDDISGQRFDVKVYMVERVKNGSPWALTMDNKRNYKFVFNNFHEIFTQTSFLPLEALLISIANSICFFSRDNKIPFELSDVIYSLRKKYHLSDKLDLPQLLMDARSELTIVASALSKSVDDFSCENIYDSLDQNVKKTIQSEMANTGISNPQDKIVSGEFLIHAPHHSLIEFIEKYPELFFDGKLWDAKYQKLKFSDNDATYLARRNTLVHYVSLLNDIAWLANKNSLDNDPIELIRVNRSKISLEMLRSYRNE